MLAIPAACRHAVNSVNIVLFCLVLKFSHVVFWLPLLPPFVDLVSIGIGKYSTDSIRVMVPGCCHGYLRIY